jgi:hypothetical protein
VEKTHSFTIYRTWLLYIEHDVTQMRRPIESYWYVCVRPALTLWVSVWSRNENLGTERDSNLRAMNPARVYRGLMFVWVETLESEYISYELHHSAIIYIHVYSNWSIIYHVDKTCCIISIYRLWKLGDLNIAALHRHIAIPKFLELNVISVCLMLYSKQIWWVILASF